MNFYGVRQSSGEQMLTSQNYLSDTISISKKQTENRRVREKAKPLSCFLTPQQVLQPCSEVEWQKHPLTEVRGTTEDCRV